MNNKEEGHYYNLSDNFIKTDLKQVDIEGKESLLLTYCYFYINVITNTVN